MKKEASVFFKTLLILSFAIAIIGGAVLYIGFTTQYDTELSHFEFGSVFAALGAAVAVLAAALGFAGGIFSKKGAVFVQADRFSFPEALTSGVSAFLSFAYAIYLFVLETPPDTRKGFFYAEAILVGLSGIYFVMKALGMTVMNRKLGFISIVPSLMCAIAALNAYFNVNVPMNSPLKVFELLMIVSLMLYFKDECGLYISRPNILPRYAFSVLVAISLGGMTALSRIVLSVAKPDDFPISVISAAYMIQLWIHIITVSLSNYKRGSGITEETEAHTSDTEEKE